MQNNTHRQGTIVDNRNATEAIDCASHQLDVGCSMLDFGCFPAASELNVPAEPFDELRAAQARAALIQFTKTFFGPDCEPTDVDTRVITNPEGGQKEWKQANIGGAAVKKPTTSIPRPPTILD